MGGREGPGPPLRLLNLTILERTPDVGRLRAKIERALAAIPRLTERVVSAPLRIAPPEWRPTRTFDLDYHLRRVAVAGAGWHA